MPKREPKARIPSPLNQVQETGMIGGAKTANHQNVKAAPPVGGLKKQTIYLPHELARWLKAHASLMGRDMSDVVTEVLEEYHAKVEAEEKK